VNNVRTLLAAGILVVGVATPAVAGKAAPPAPVPMRVALAEVVLVGKVTGFENKTVKAPLWPGSPQEGELKVAVLKIESALAGAKGLTHVKVAYMPAEGGGPRRRPGPQLTSGGEYLLFLKKQPGKDFYRAYNYYDVVKKDAGTDRAVADARKAAKLLTDPVASLRSKDSGERFTTAAMLVYRYRAQQAGESKQEPIPAAESKLILEALAGADWGNPPGREYGMSPQMLFYRLGATPADGWNQPADGQQFAAAAKAWLKDNASKFRIKRFVADKK
jgi:hypothetical protein